MWNKVIILGSFGLAGLCVVASMLRKPPVVNVEIAINDGLDDGEIDNSDLPPDYLFGDVDLTESDWHILDDLDFPCADD
jgi:hypothetical protein